MIISAIAAMGRDGVIGCQGQMPWHLPDDLRNFRRLTAGKTVVMGRKTFQSLAKPLPGRENWVLSGNEEFQKALQQQFPEVKIWAALPELLQAAQAREGELMVMGGAQVYQQMFPFLQRQYLSIIDADFSGDAFYPHYSSSQWQVREKIEHPLALPGSPWPWQFLYLEKN